MKQLGIRTKLFLTVLALAVPAVVFVGGLGYFGSKAAVTRTTLEHLTSVRANKANQVENYFRQTRSQTRTLANGRMIIEAMRDFEAAYQALENVELSQEQRDEVAAFYRHEFLPRVKAHTDSAVQVEPFIPQGSTDLYLQYKYMVSNHYPVGEKDRLESTGDGTAYDLAHLEYQPGLRDFVHEFGFHDLFLVDPAGRIVFSVFKETELGSSLADGPYRESNLAAVFTKVQAEPSGDAVVLVDFAPYVPSYGAPASFVATAIEEAGKRIGALVLQLPVGEIDRLMTNDRNWRIDGLGATGETYLVGPDFKMRSNSRFILEDPDGYAAVAEAAGASAVDVRHIRDFGTTILLQDVRTPALEAAMRGESATRMSTDYRGEAVLSSYAPLDLEGVKWAIQSEIDASEAFAKIRTFSRNLVLSMVPALLAVLLASWFGSRRVVAPIVALDGAARGFASGERQVEVPVTSGDELGRLTGSFNQMVSAIRQKTADLEKTNQELEGISSVILRWVPDGTIVFMNDFGLKLFGYGEGELIGRPLVGTIVPESDEVKKNVQRMIDEIAANPSRYEIDETENVGKAGEWVWMAWRNTPILGPQGNLQEILTIGIDITERRRIEERVAEQKQMLENTLESLTHPFYVIDANDFTIKIANSAAKELGFSDRSTCHALTHGSDTPCASAEDPCPLVEVKRTGKPTTMEHVHYDAEGNPRFVEVHGYPIFDADGNVTQMIEYSLDITRRKEFEAKLRQSEDQNRSMVGNIPGVVYRCLMDDAWTMIFISDEIESLCGYPATDFIGESPVRTFASIMHADDLEPIARNAGAAVEERRPYTNEYRVIDREGQVHWVYARGRAIYDDDGTPLFLDGAIFDVTERKQLDLQLAEAKEAAEAANRAKSAFLANMSHELRTPMAAIIGYSEMLIEDAEDDGLDEMIPDLKKVNDAGNHLLALINDILDLSKIEAGRMDLYLERFDLAQMLQEAVATVAPLVSKNENQLVTDFGSGLGEIRADLTKLRQALFNLLSNAAKFTEGGTVTLAASRERRGDGDWITLSVSDSGIGIADDKLDHVFEEFSQADASTTREYGGTGLGLPISRRFCQMMGGDITVASTIGSGSTFTIELPAKVDALEAAKASARSDQQQVKEVPEGVRPILVIDDDPNSRELLKRTLESDHFTVVTAPGGEQGLAMARDLKPALITLDVMMPGMDGWAVLKELKEDSELKTVPVIMVTIESGKGLGYTLGAVEHLTKPVDRDILRQLVRRHSTVVGSGHALVVDDDESVRALFRRSLESDGWSVTEAGDGAAALDRVAERKPDLILLDLMMPVMDGFEFVLHFRGLEGCQLTPIIVVTSKDLDEGDRQRLAGGVEHIIPKGASTRKDLLVQVRSLMVQRGGTAPTDDA